MLDRIAKLCSGPLLVGLAAFLWATDALTRYPVSGKVDPTWIVLVEHIIAILVLAPWIVMKHRDSIFSLNLKEWFAAVFSGVGGSALGTLFFTASFLYVNPSVSVLLQKLQPVMVVIIAYIFLGERPVKKFYFWSIIALGAGIALSFPDFNFKFLNEGVSLHSKGIQYSLGAGILWAASTVSGKILLQRTPPAVATFWRFFFGCIALAVVQGLANEIPDWKWISDGPLFLSLIYLSVVPGLFAMLVYYAGLARTPASVTTFIELLYPIGAVILNTAFLHTPLETVQTIAGLILVVAVAMISF